MKDIECYISRYPNGKKSKIALITWYHYRNYGTALQASALFKVISNIGFDVRLIQYKPIDNTLQKMNLLLFCRKVCIWMLKILFGPKYYHNNYREKLFQNYLDARIYETDPIKSEVEFEKLNTIFDAFICGSDQIWTPLKLNDKYYLSFVKDSSKKIAYAPSMGVSEITDSETKKRISELLKEFRYLSIREKQGAKLIMNITGQEAKVVLDPTFLLTASEWDEYAEVSSAKKLKQPYILCYYLSNPSKYRKYVKKAAKKWGLSVYEIPTIRHLGRYSKFPFEVGPTEFLSLIKNASFVFTDSFHGMVFSIIYQVPFIVFERFTQDDPMNQNSRIYNLIELFSLESRLMHPSDICKIEDIPKFDFSECYEKLDKLRKESFDYLQSSLYKSTKYNQ